MGSIFDLLISDIKNTSEEKKFRQKTENLQQCLEYKHSSIYLETNKKKNNIKAIETNYKGFKFRSRLEARWAVLFDYLGVEWEYEPEGFDLGEAGWYLPDFKIKFSPDNHSCRSAFIEIKGEEPGHSEKTKYFALAEMTHCPVFLFWGQPRLIKSEISDDIIIQAMVFFSNKYSPYYLKFNRELRDIAKSSIGDPHDYNDEDDFNDSIIKERAVSLHSLYEELSKPIEDAIQRAEEAEDDVLHSSLMDVVFSLVNLMHNPHINSRGFVNSAKRSFVVRIGGDTDHLLDLYPTIGFVNYWLMQHPEESRNYGLFSYRGAVELGDFLKMSFGDFFPMRNPTDAITAFRSARFEFIQENI